MTQTLPDVKIYDECSALEIMGKAAEALEEIGESEKAKEMCFRVAVCDKTDPYIAKAIIDEYVNVIDMSMEENDEQFFTE